MIDPKWERKTFAEVDAGAEMSFERAFAAKESSEESPKPGDCYIAGVRAERDYYRVVAGEMLEEMSSLRQKLDATQMMLVGMGDA